MAIKIKTTERKRIGGNNSAHKTKVVIKVKNNSKLVIAKKKTDCY